MKVGKKNALFLLFGCTVMNTRYDGPKSPNFLYPRVPRKEYKFNECL